MARAENTQLIDRIQEFYRQYYADDIGELGQNYPLETKSLYVDWDDLYKFDPDLADDFRSQPEQLREYAEEALRLYDLPVDVKLGQAHVRVMNLPETTQIEAISADSRGNLIETRGVVREATDVRPKITNAAFECQRCGTLTRIPQTTGDFQEPHECQGCERQGPFRINFDQSEFIDIQELRMQGLPGRYPDSDTAPRIDVTIKDDITGTVSIGDRVTITGIVKLDQRGSTRNPSAQFDIYMDGMAIEEAVDPYPSLDITEADEREIVDLADDEPFDALVESIAPSVHGHEELKAALVLQQFGGVAKDFPDGARSRGTIHTLILSDPGNGISRLIGRSSRFSPRAISVSGTDTSKVGLTAAAAPSSDAPGDDPWDIKAGATVMADRGVVCLDNIEELSSEAETALAGVMANQRVDASKATQTKSFPARTSVLAAGKPKYGRFDQFQPVAEQIEFAPQLISSFDLIFAAQDVPAEDEETSEHILSLSRAGEHEKAADAGNESIEESVPTPADFEPPVEADLLEKYVVYARTNCYPVMTEEAKEELKDFFTSIRKRAGERDAPMPVSARQLESLVRLAEASARTRLAATVEPQDIERVIDIVRESIHYLDPAESDGVEPRAAGANTDQRERTKILKKIVSDLEESHEQGAPEAKVLERATSAGLNPDMAEEELHNLRQKGEIYAPNEDRLRTT